MLETRPIHSLWQTLITNRGSATSSNISGEVQSAGSRPVHMQQQHRQLSIATNAICTNVIGEVRKITRICIPVVIYNGHSYKYVTEKNLLNKLLYGAGVKTLNHCHFDLCYYGSIWQAICVSPFCLLGTLTELSVPKMNNSKTSIFIKKIGCQSLFNKKINWHFCQLLLIQLEK